MTEGILSEAERFLQPVLKKEEFVRAKAGSVVDRLFESSGHNLEEGETKQGFVVDKALSLLEAIHKEIATDLSLAAKVLNTSNSRRVLDALLDLISLEGIYPNLLPGVGSPIERRVQSVLQGGVTITDIGKDQSFNRDDLARITERLYHLVTSGNGVATAIQQRTLVDVIAAMTQLAYSSDDESRELWSDKFSDLVNSLPPVILFPSLISLLHNTTPVWLKPHITVPLSLLPMRRDGVRQTITFVAKSTPQRSAQNSEQAASNAKGPTLPIEVLAQVSKVLSAVPGTVSADDYFKNISAQLIQLLDDRDPDAQRAAAYTISHGILSKRLLGAPGSVGWKYFAEPLISTIHPSVLPARNHSRSSEGITRALEALFVILLTFSNPALSKRLLGTLIPSLWAVACISAPNSKEHDLASKLLEHYNNAVAGSKGLMLVADNLLYDGEAGWKFDKMPKGHESESVGIIRRNGESQGRNEVYKLELMQARIAEYIRLVEALHDDSELGLFFAEILRRVLAKSNTVLQSDTDSILQPVMYATIARELLSEQSSRLTGNISVILGVMEEILSSQYNAMTNQDGNNSKAISRANLSNIVSSNEEELYSNPSQELDSSLSICLPWMVLVAQTDMKDLSSTEHEKFKALEDLLSKILRVKSVSRASKDSIRSVLSMLDAGASEVEVHGSTGIDLASSDMRIHANAMKNLQADEPPIRVQGLSQLEDLVHRRSPLVSTNSATLTALSVLQDPDSFVYLSAIKVLTALARREPRVVLNTLREAYHDITEQASLDVRLRIGEALQTIIEDIGSIIPSQTVDDLSKTLLFIASRRVYRAKTHDAQQKAAKIPRASESANNDSDSEMEIDDQKHEKDLQTILDSWHGKSGAEDLRIRASALTLIGAAFEYTDITAMGTSIPASLEVITQILRKEGGQENAILRRAALLVIMSIIKAQQAAPDHPTSLLASGASESGLSGVMIEESLQSLAVEDDDSIVRGHAEEVLQAMQDWKQQITDEMMSGAHIRFGLADNTGKVQLRGLDVDPMAQSGTRTGKTPKIEEID